MLTLVFRGGLGPETWRYVLRKIRRVYPIFILSFIPSFIISSVYSRTLNPAYSVEAIINSFFLSLPELSFTTMGGFVSYLANGVSWFFSACFLVTAIIYPFLRTHYETYVYFVAPISSAFVLGYLSQNFGHLNLWISNFNGFLYPGILRSFVEVSLGAVCYEVSQKYLKKCPAFVPVCLYLASGMLMARPLVMSNQDFIVLVLLAAAITTTFAVEKTDRKSGGYAASALGKMSVAILLNHIYYFYLFECFHWEAPYLTRLSVYLICTLVTAVVMIYLEKAVMRRLHKSRAM